MGTRNGQEALVMDSQELPVGFLFQQLASALPGVLVYIGGMVLLGINLKRIGQGALLGLIGCGLLLLTMIGGSALQAWAMRGRTASEIGMSMATVGALTSLLHALGIALLIAGILSGSSRYRPER
jgi:hypothetical protein